MSLVSGRVIDSVLRLEFFDPSSRNSFSLQAAEELAEIIFKEKGRYDGILFFAKGRVFCSGGNLSDYASANGPEPGLATNRRITAVLEEFSKLPVPTVCAIQGDCFGGGLELMSAFDEVMAVPSAMFGFWQRKVGLSFGWGGGARLMKRIGEHKARRLALNASTIGAFEAFDMGLIDGVFLNSQLIDEAVNKIQCSKSLPKSAVEPTKSLTLLNENSVFEKLWWNTEHQSILKKYRR